MEQPRDELPSPISLPNEEEQGFCILGDFTPEGLRSAVTIQEATNSLCRLESPYSRCNCSDGKCSRLNADAKGKIFFTRSKTMSVGLMMNCIL